METTEEKEKEKSLGVVEEIGAWDINTYNSPENHRYNLSIAPMLEITTKHYMALMRSITKHTLIYSEMINVDEVINSKFDALDFDLPNLEPICVQFAGRDPEKCRLAAAKAKNKGVKELNFNCGCPSQRVECGNFGAVLMKEPKIVGECLQEMNKSVFSSIKCRIGIDEFDWKFLDDFISVTKSIGHVKKYVLHSRIAIMGIDTIKNRTIPPLKYDIAEEIHEKYGDLNVVVNGGIRSFEEVKKFNSKGLGAMIGRFAYENPWAFRSADSEIFNKISKKLSRKEVIYSYAEYLEKHVENYEKNTGNLVVSELVKPLTNLFAGEKYSKRYLNKLFEITRGSKALNKAEKDIKKKEKLYGMRDFLYEVVDYYEKLNEKALNSL